MLCAVSACDDANILDMVEWFYNFVYSPDGFLEHSRTIRVGALGVDIYIYIENIRSTQKGSDEEVRGGVNGQ